VFVTRPFSGAKNVKATEISNVFPLEKQTFKQNIQSGDVLTKVAVLANIASALTVTSDTVILNRTFAPMLACIRSLAGIHQLAVI
jgi:hypothetical protein